MVTFMFVDIVWKLMQLKVVTPAHHVLFHLKLSVMEKKCMKMYHHVTQKKHLKLGEIIGVNPNSYETVKEVLLNLFEQAEVPQKKKWVHVGFGGVPYQIAADLIENMKQCTICDALVDLKVETEDEHCKECHPEEENIVLKKAFGRILLTCFRVVWGTKISLVFSL